MGAVLSQRTRPCEDAGGRSAEPAAGVFTARQREIQEPLLVTASRCALEGIDRLDRRVRTDPRRRSRRAVGFKLPPTESDALRFYKPLKRAHPRGMLLRWEADSSTDSL